MNYADTFRNATGNRPYDYQCRLACGERVEGESEEKWLSHGTTCESTLIDVPTGLGKTAAVVLAWLWNRIPQPDQNARAAWPRRLVYCLPMRTLVEQTAGEVKKWITNLLSPADEVGFSEAAKQQLAWLKDHSPVVLMGGEEKIDWDLYPDRDAILIGTQDMLLSRALNRGYAAGRARWPIDFALLNNDCLWVLDEVQLMGSGFASSLQLQAWRDSLTLRQPEHLRFSEKQPSSALPTASWWMSATLAEHWLNASSEMRTRGRVTRLWKDKIQCDPTTDLRARPLFDIPKSVTRSEVSFPVFGRNRDERVNAIRKYAAELAGHLVQPQNRIGKKRGNQAQETEDILTLVVCNTVERATAVYLALRERRIFDDAHLRLLHSRFRPNERKGWPDLLKRFENGDDEHAGARILIATQVIEAGVDISAPVLYTELCPIASLIQRLGRCARRAGEFGKAFWIGFDAFSSTHDLESQTGAARPYLVGEIAAAFTRLDSSLAASLTKVDARNVEQPAVP